MQPHRMMARGAGNRASAKGVELGWEPLRDIVVTRRSRPLAEIHVAAHGKQEDDQTLALIRLN